MNYDEARLDRALAALPLEEPPQDLRARILLATVHRPQPVFRPWELWVLGCAFAICTWLIVAIVGSPAAADEQFRAAIEHAMNALVLALNPSLLIWFGIGGLAALVLPFSETALTVLHREKP